MRYRSPRLAMFPIALAVLFWPQQALSADLWLDRELEKWNRPSAALPNLPEPTSSHEEIPDNCSKQIREPEVAAERAVVKKGWKLYGPVQRSGTTRVFMAMSSVDGMCRPMGYHAFVYSEGRYAGTLSPVAMNARSDGAVTNIRVVNPTRITATFARYGSSDALCCPSRRSTVEYNIRQDEVPDLAATNVTTAPMTQTGQQVQGGDTNNASPLFGKRWVLRKIGTQKLSADKPYIEFDREQKKVSGDAGCNRFSGGIEISGTSLKLSRMISTKRACLSAETSNLETDFLRSLETVTRFEAQGNTLRLYAADGAVLAFEAAP
jgi:heat shock protein HslJ